MLRNSVFYDVSLECKVVFQVLKIVYAEACLGVCMSCDGVLVSVQGTVFYIALIKGSANFIFHHIEAASCMATFVYDVFYAVRIYIRIGY